MKESQTDLLKAMERVENSCEPTMQQVLRSLHLALKLRPHNSQIINLISDIAWGRKWDLDNLEQKDEIYNYISKTLTLNYFNYEQAHRR